MVVGDQNATDNGHAIFLCFPEVGDFSPELTAGWNWATIPLAMHPRCRRSTYLRWLAAASALLGATSGAQVVELDPTSTTSRRGLADYVRYLELPGTPAGTLETVLAAPRSRFQPIDRRYIDFGITPNTLWLALDVRNTSARDGEWRLSLNVRFMTEIVVYQRTADGDAVLLNQTETSTFAERPVRFRLLAAPMSLSARQTSELLIGYRSHGATALPISIETAASFAQRYGREDAINAAAYAAIAFLAALSLLQAFLFAQRTQLSYAAYLSATLLYIGHMDGWTFQLLWPESPRWNSYAAVPLGMMMTVTALMFTRSFVETRVIAPALDRGMLALIALAIATSVAGFLVAEASLKGFAYLVTSVSAVTCLGAAVLAHLRGRPAMRFFILGWLGVVAGVFVTSIANNVPAMIQRAVANVIPKLTIMFDALMFYTALADRARAWRVQRDKALRGELDALEARQRVTEQLHRVERERLEAQVLAQAKSEKLAMASHDIRQPLTSLRLALERLIGADGAPAAAAYGARESLDYLQKLAEEYSADTVASEPTTAEPTTAEPAASSQPPSFAIATLLRNVDLMFRDEAEAKGLAFRCRRSSVNVQGDAMGAMRLVSNLVANAIKYTERGKVLVGCRRLKKAIRVVVADTGRGIHADELSRVLRARERGSAARETDGHGLGLAIATALARQNGYGFDCRSRPGRGTVFFVDLPLTVEHAT
jgi:signal transduction histidine kinase